MVDAGMIQRWRNLLEHLSDVEIEPILVSQFFNRNSLSEQLQLRTAIKENR